MEALKVIRQRKLTIQLTEVEKNEDVETRKEPSKVRFCIHE